MSDSGKAREFQLFHSGLSRQWCVHSQPTYWRGEDDEYLSVIERSAYDQAQEQINSLKIQIKEVESYDYYQKEYIKTLEAQLWVAKDSQLRTYDGLAEKADEYDELVEKNKAWILEQLKDRKNEP